MEKIIHLQKVGKPLLMLNIAMALVYFSWWFLPGHVGNPYLYYALLSGEVYHILMALGFWYTLWPRKNRSPQPLNYQKANYPQPGVDVFITVAGEPVSVVSETAKAARDMDYQNHKVYLLNDGFVAKKDNWQSIEKLAADLGINCITRKEPGGAKAGNINHALSQTFGQFVVIFDADMVPHKDFLQKLMPYFNDESIGFVQSPQFYKNALQNGIASGAWEQQELFFGPIMAGKDSLNSAFICGTNVVIKREALEQAGGMYEKSIAEDFLTSLYIHQKGWGSHYIKEVLAEGLAPEDLLSYYKQQLRWARGSLEVLFGENPLFKKGLSGGQRAQYLISALYYFNGVVALLDMVMPLIFLFTGIVPVSSTTTTFALFFIPFMALNLNTLYIASNSTVTFRAMSFSHSSFFLQLQALFSVLTRQKTAFSITPKQAQTGNFLTLAYPHLLYAVLLVLGTAAAVLRSGFSPAVLTNTAWGVFNLVLFLPFILSAYPWKTLFTGSVQQRSAYER